MGDEAFDVGEAEDRRQGAARYSPVGALALPVRDPERLEALPVELSGCDGPPEVLAQVSAAKLFIAWLYSEDGQASVANTGIQGTMPDAPRVEGLEKAKLFTYAHKDVLSEYDSVHEVIAGAFSK